MNALPSRYRLQVSLSIVREEQLRGDDYWRPTQERLNVSEEIDLGALDFVGVMAVLARLHESMLHIRPAESPYERGCRKHGLPLVPGQS